MRVAILHGHIGADAPPDEQDSLIEAAAVSRALARLGHEVHPVALGLNLDAARAALRAIEPAVVFNLVESVEGRGRLIHLATALLDHLGLPYTGARTEAMFATSNKLLAKRLLAGAGLPTPAWVSAGELAAAPALAGRYIVKSVWEHASIGIAADSVAGDIESLRRVLDDRRGRFGGEWFAERYVEGRELNLSLLAGEHGPEVLPPAEIEFQGYGAERLRIVDYRAKWHPEAYEYHHTPRRFDLPEADRPLLEQLAESALACWRLFDVRGYARVDFRVDSAGRPWVLEVNTNPCLAPDAGFLAAAGRASLTLEEVVRSILQDAL